MDIYGRYVQYPANLPVTMSASLDTLPDEVIIRIFKELGVSDIINCSLVVLLCLNKPRHGSYLTPFADVSSLP